MACLSGCAALSIPSYRNADGSLYPISTEASEDVTYQLEEEVECDEANYVPAFPTIPTPKCIQRWKEQKSLPEGPNGLRFHPLPTRPMFSQKPNAQPQAASNMQGPALTGESVVVPGQTVLDGSSSFGSIPRGKEWTELSQPAPEANPGEPNPIGEPKKPGSTLPLQPKSAPELRSVPGSSEELPAPKTKL